VTTAKAAQTTAAANVVESKKEKIEKRTITAEQIAVRAYFLWQERGYDHGGDAYDWARAEAELSSVN
jgi:hypothetical protein